ncbi:MAG TPA: acetyl-CoA carboxylase biotin carboxyl carrier protein, partial [Phycisphaerales bacterium]|nr:acetyl-CoA carboxylase biotin carboxyl carrier protein [Phycisphaerales bacterium]
MGEAQAPAAEAPKLADPTAGQVAIESPMVGTFYSSPNPDAAPFVKIGQTVTPDTVVCLIEAMKVFNEIKAEKSGVIEQILVKSGQAVEFGQKLFLIRPS